MQAQTGFIETQLCCCDSGAPGGGGGGGGGVQGGWVEGEDVVGVEAGRRDGRGQGAAAGRPRQQRVRRQGLLQCNILSLEYCVFITDRCKN